MDQFHLDNGLHLACRENGMAVGERGEVLGRWEAFKNVKIRPTLGLDQRGTGQGANTCEQQIRRAKTP